MPSKVMTHKGTIEHVKSNIFLGTQIRKFQKLSITTTVSRHLKNTTNFIDMTMI